MLFVAFATTCLAALPRRPEKEPILFEPFTSDNYTSYWVMSEMANVTGEFVIKEAHAPQALPGEKMIVADNASAYYGLSYPFNPPLDFKERTLVLQYETRFLKDIECGGAYIKLFGRENYEAEDLCNETRYVVMFGPDVCGDNKKLHFIFRHQNPVSGLWQEKHMTNGPPITTDGQLHLYTLIVRPDNTFEIMIDAETVKQGDLLSDFDPPVNPTRDIDDPEDRKPADWVDEEEIDDPEAFRPDDWDEAQPEYIPDPDRLEPPEDWYVNEPKLIADPEAVIPDDWDDDMYGEWEAPMIPNPKCQTASGCGEYDPPLIENDEFTGKWVCPRIPNPAYKGEWKPRQIANVNYFEDYEPHRWPEFAGIGFEEWIVTKDIAFGNVYLDDDESAVKRWNEVHFKPKHRRQEAEKKRIDDESSGKKKPRWLEEQEEEEEAQHGLVPTLKRFAQTITKAWKRMYRTNEAGTSFVTLICVFVPAAVMLSCCCDNEMSEKQKRRRRRLMKKRVRRAAKKRLEELRRGETDSAKGATQEEEDASMDTSQGEDD